MGDKKPRWDRPESERFKRWFFERIEGVDALTRAIATRVSEVDNDRFASLISTCDHQDRRYIRAKLGEIIERLKVWDDQLAEDHGFCDS